MILRGPVRQLADGSLLDCFDSWSQRTEVAVTDHEGGQKTFVQLYARSRALSAGLQKLGAGPGRRVGLLFQRNIESYELFLAILLSGATYVPLDPAYPEELLQMICRDAGVYLVLSKSAELDSQAGYLSPPLPANHQVYLIYTSGSTGTPKGVPITQRSLLNLLHSLAERLELGPADRILSLASWGFDISLLDLLLPLSHGASLYLAPADAAANPLRLLDALDRARATFMQATPSTWRLLQESAPALVLPETVASGGEALSETLAAYLRNQSRRAWNLYGPTETCIWSSAWRIQSGTISLGEPLWNTNFYVVNERGEMVGEGASGELQIGGRGVAGSYWQRPELSAQRFVPACDGSGQTVYRTGDLVRVSQDRLEFLGRLDHQVKIGGLRLELEGVEALLKTHPAIQEAVVCPGQASDAPRLVAFYQADVELDSRELRDFLAARLPRGAVPVLYQRLSGLPLNTRGKLDRVALSSRAASLHQGLGLQELWHRVIGQGARPDDDLFDLGLSSLQVLELCRVLEQHFQIDVPVALVYQQRTMAGILERLEQSEPPVCAGLVRLRPGQGERFFLCHTFTGGLPQSLAEGLPQHWDVWGLTPARLASASLADQACFQLQVLKEAGLDRLRIVGYSFGALLAFEIAVQAQKSGIPTDFLCLIDPPGLWTRPAPRLPPWIQSLLTSTVRAPRVWLQLTFWLLRLGLIETVPLSWSKRLLWSFPGFRDLSANAQDLAGWNYLCETTYRPGAHKGTTCLVHTTGREFLQRYWGRRVKHLRVQTLEGDHFALLTQPLVAEVACCVGQLWELSR